MMNYLYSFNLNHIYFVVSNLDHDNSILRVSKNIVKIKKYTRNFVTKSPNKPHENKNRCIRKNILKKMYNLSLFWKCFRFVFILNYCNIKRLRSILWQNKLWLD